MNINIQSATRADAAEILALQKLCYQSEAALIDDYTIPPLMQTLEQTLDEFAQHTVLKVLREGRIVGSVRCYEEGSTCYIGKLIVHPDWQNRGIGSALLKAAEQQFATATRFELFTGEKSAKNLYLYQKYGYHIYQRKQVSDKLRLVWLEKDLTP